MSTLSRGGNYKPYRERKRLDSIFECYVAPSGICAFCDEEAGQFALPPGHEEGLRSTLVCRDCHEKFTEAEKELSRLRYAVSCKDYACVARAVSHLLWLKRWLSLRVIEGAIDAVRDTPEKKRYLMFKDELTIILLHRFGDHLNCVVRADNRLASQGMAKITWWKSGSVWCCHLPGDKLQGRFREMYLATQE